MSCIISPYSNEVSAVPEVAISQPGTGVELAVVEADKLGLSHGDPVTNFTEGGPNELTVAVTGAPVMHANEIGDLPAFYFDGSSRLRINFASGSYPLTLFFVVKKDWTYETAQYLFRNAGSYSSFPQFVRYVGADRIDLVRISDYAMGTHGESAGDVVLYEVELLGGPNTYWSHLYKNGSLILSDSSTGSALFGDIEIAGTSAVSDQNFRGHIAAFAAVMTANGDSETAEWRDYLASKYGISLL